MANFLKADPYHAPNGQFDFGPGGGSGPTGAPRGRPAGGGGAHSHPFMSAGGRLDAAATGVDPGRTLTRDTSGILGGAAGDFAARSLLSGLNASGAATGARIGAAAGTILDPVTFGLGTPAGAAIGGLLGANALPIAASAVGSYVATKIGGALYDLRQSLTGATSLEHSVNAGIANTKTATGDDSTYTPRDVAGEIGSHVLGTGADIGLANAAMGLVPDGLGGPLASAALHFGAAESPGIIGDISGYHAGRAAYDAVKGPGGDSKVKKLFPAKPPAQGAPPATPARPGAPGAPSPSGQPPVPGRAPAGPNPSQMMHPPGPGPDKPLPPPPRLFKHPVVEAHPDFRGTYASLKQSAPAALFGQKQWSAVKGSLFGHYVQQQIDTVADAMDEQQNKQVIGPHLFGKNFGFRMPNDMNAQLVNSGEGVPANIKFLRRMQAIDDQNRKKQLRGLTNGPKLASVQPRPNEDERQYRDRVKSLFQSNTDRPEVYKVSIRPKCVTPDATPEDAFTIQAEFAKALNPDDQLKQGLVYGWASIIEKDGQEVTDHQGDRIEQDELLHAAHDYMKRRDGGVMHDETGHNIGHIVESVIFTHDLQKALGIDLGKVGWLIGYQITDPRVRAMAQSRVLKAFSIGGKGRREPVNG